MDLITICKKESIHFYLQSRFFHLVADMHKQFLSWLLPLVAIARAFLIKKKIPKFNTELSFKSNRKKAKANTNATKAQTKSWYNLLSMVQPPFSLYNLETWKLFINLTFCSSASKFLAKFFSAYILNIRFISCHCFQKRYDTLIHCLFPTYTNNLAFHLLYPFTPSILSQETVPTLYSTCTDVWFLQN